MHLVNREPSRCTFGIAARLTQVLDDETHTYLYGNGRIAQLNLSEAEYFLGDALGSVRQLVDGAGSVVAPCGRLAQSYTPYGETLSRSGTGETDFAFTGEAVDAYTGLVYLRARWYAPSTGRFITKDMWQGEYTRPLSLNSWLYVEGNPINYIDPTGFVACSINFRYCKIIAGPYAGFFIDTHHWDNSKLLSELIKSHLQELLGVYLGSFEENVLLAGYARYKRTYYTAIPVSTSNTVLDGITLGILMDYNFGLEGFEGLDPTCWAGDRVVFGHRCSSFSNEDLPSAYLGFVAYKNNWNLKETLSKLVTNVDEDTEGTHQFPASIVEQLLDSQNRCFTPKLLEPSTDQFVYHSWPSYILYDAIGPGEYWATSPSAFVQPAPTPPAPGRIPTP